MGGCGCVSVCVRACVRACVRMCVRACVRACVCACVRVCVRACVRVYYYTSLDCRLCWRKSGRLAAGVRASLPRGDRHSSWFGGT